MRLIKFIVLLPLVTGCDAAVLGNIDQSSLDEPSWKDEEPLAGEEAEEARHAEWERTANLREEQSAASEDPIDRFNDYQGKDDLEPRDGYQSTSCRAGFVPVGSYLCISVYLENAKDWYTANADCRKAGSRVCNVSDLQTLYYYQSNDGNYNPYGLWLGERLDDGRIACGNKHVTYNNDPDRLDFDGECSYADSRTYYCCHDES